jgi:hypothetical protein
MPFLEGEDCVFSLLTTLFDLRPESSYMTLNHQIGVNEIR